MKICVTSQKGGCGKTTTAALIALTIAAEGKRVLCIDCDPQGGLTSLLGAEPGPGVFELIIKTAAEPVQARGVDLPGPLLDQVMSVPVQARGVDLLRADHRLDKVAYSMTPRDIARVVNSFDHEYIIIDTPPTVQGISRAAAQAADMVIIPADIAITTIGPTLYTLEALDDIDRATRVLLIGKDPKEGTRGFYADLYREFHDRIKPRYAGTIPRTAGAQKAAAGLQRVPRAISNIIGGILWT